MLVKMSFVSIEGSNRLLKFLTMQPHLKLRKCHRDRGFFPRWCGFSLSLFCNYSKVGLQGAILNAIEGSPGTTKKPRMNINRN